MEAGKIHSEACEIARDSVKPGVSQLDVVHHVEEYIRERAGLAFPVNVSVDNEVAHKSPSPEDEVVFTDEDVICVDIGVHVDGYVADGAFSIDLSGDYEELIDSNNEALKKGLDTVESGVNVNTIGTVIEDTLQDRGYEPIRNLFGHGLSRFEAHTDPKVPNSGGINSQTLETGDVVAVEPFASTGDDQVHRGSEVSIFEFDESKKVRNSQARDILEQIEDNYSNFPFSTRWINQYNEIGMKILVRDNVVKPHPVLSVNNGVVTQSEHTVIVTDDGCEKVTRHLQ